MMMTRGRFELCCWYLKLSRNVGEGRDNPFVLGIFQDESAVYMNWTSV